MEREHPLRAYLAKTGEKQADFARRAGISESYLSLIMSWERGVSLVTAQKLEGATKRKVRMADLIREEPA